jgi:hypothetical protein
MSTGAVYTEELNVLLRTVLHSSGGIVLFPVSIKIG